MVFIQLTKEQKGLLAVYGGVATDVFGLTMAIPVFARTVSTLEQSRDVGLLFVATAGSMIASIFVGKFSAKFGSKMVFVVTSFGTAGSFQVLLLLRISHVGHLACDWRFVFRHNSYLL